MRHHASILLLAAVAVAGALTPRASFAQAPSKDTARKILAKPPRPKRPDLPPSQLPLQFLRGERIALVGSSTAERMNLFETLRRCCTPGFPTRSW
ncbi:MAG: hypothetical protein U0794_06835 [Isosphaeraceae bacterium]